MAARTGNAKEELAKKPKVQRERNRLTKSMSIADLIKAMEPEIKKALPEVITPEKIYQNGIVGAEYHTKVEGVYADQLSGSTDERCTVRTGAKYSFGTGLSDSV